MGCLTLAVVSVASTLALAGPAWAQQPIDPVDFRPFVDRGVWHRDDLMGGYCEYRAA